MVSHTWCAICAAPCLPTSIETDSEWLKTRRSLSIGQPKVNKRRLLPSDRQIQVHLACLEVVRLIAPPRKENDIFPMRFDVYPLPVSPFVMDVESPVASAAHGGGEDQTGLDFNLLISWSLPKWAGPFPWQVTPPLSLRSSALGKASSKFKIQVNGVRFFACVRRCPFESWRGLDSQIQRWKMSGTHLLKDDLISPTELGLPVHLSKRPSAVRQSSKLFKLPEEILLLILAELQANDKALDTFRQTCLLTRNLTLPSSYWFRRTIASATELGKDLAQTYRTRSRSILLKVGDTTPGWQIDIMAPLQIACNAMSGQDAVDLWEWWMYDLHWRSRRRIWRCAVEATATVQFADWASVV